MLWALNSTATVVDVPSLFRLKELVIWHLVTKYSEWQFT
jgi:hypothetical protein